MRMDPIGPSTSSGLSGTYLRQWNGYHSMISIFEGLLVNRVAMVDQYPTVCSPACLRHSAQHPFSRQIPKPHPPIRPFAEYTLDSIHVRSCRCVNTVNCCLLFEWASSVQSAMYTFQMLQEFLQIQDCWENKLIMFCVTTSTQFSYVLYTLLYTITQTCTSFDHDNQPKLRSHNELSCSHISKHPLTTRQAQVG